MISDIDDRDTPVIIYQYIRDWYQKNKKVFSPHLIEEYGLEKLINIDIKTYPLEYSQCTPQDLRRFLSPDLVPSRESIMVMFLQEILWGIVVLTVDFQCQNCGKLEMSALFDTEAKTIFLECTQCGWIQTTDGQPYNSLKTFRLAQNDDLKMAGLI